MDPLEIRNLVRNQEDVVSRFKSCSLEILGGQDPEAALDMLGGSFRRMEKLLDICFKYFECKGEFSISTFLSYIKDLHFYSSQVSVCVSCLSDTVICFSLNLNWMLCLRFMYGIRCAFAHGDMQPTLTSGILSLPFRNEIRIQLELLRHTSADRFASSMLFLLNYMECDLKPSKRSTGYPVEFQKDLTERSQIISCVDDALVWCPVLNCALMKQLDIFLLLNGAYQV